MCGACSGRGIASQLKPSNRRVEPYTANDDSNQFCQAGNEIGY